MIARRRKNFQFEVNESAFNKKILCVGFFSFFE
jgi:hypothetical protein